MERTGEKPGLSGNTRLEILRRIRGSPATVAQLAAELGLTRNGVRAHLGTLERDGLASHTIVRRGVGKPAHLYEATEKGRGMLSRAHGPVLGAVFDVLTERMEDDDLREAMRAAGRRLGASVARPGTKMADRVDDALGVLRELGAAVRVEPGDGAGELVIRGDCCPLADLVTRHAEACLVAESMLETIAGAPVRECCDRVGVPACRFVVGPVAA